MKIARIVDLIFNLLRQIMHQSVTCRDEFSVSLANFKTPAPTPRLLGIFIGLSRESCGFYNELSVQTDNAILRNVFINVMRRKRALIDECDEYIEVDTDIDIDIDWARSLRKIYRYGRTQFENDDQQFIGWLEVAERQWLSGYEEMLSRLAPSRLRSVLQTHLPRLREAHAEIASLSRL